MPHRGAQVAPVPDGPITRWSGEVPVHPSQDDDHLGGTFRQLGTDPPLHHVGDQDARHRLSGVDERYGHPQATTISRQDRRLRGVTSPGARHIASRGPASRQAAPSQRVPSADAQPSEEALPESKLTCQGVLRLQAVR